MMKGCISSFSLAFAVFCANSVQSVAKPNEFLIVCDDPSDYAEGFGSHPHAWTPNISRLTRNGVSFSQAHCNTPIHNPSRDRNSWDGPADALTTLFKWAKYYNPAQRLKSPCSQLFACIPKSKTPPPPTKKPVEKWIIPPPLENLNKDYKVRLVYFVPSDKQVKPQYREKTEVLMRVVADVYRREMKANKQDTRGLDFEFDEDGRLKVHLVKAKNPAVFYTGKPFDLDHLLNTQQQEIWETTGFSRNRPILVFSEAGAVAEARPIPQVFSGLACVSGNIFRDTVTATAIEEQIRNFMDISTDDNNVTPLNQQSQTSNGVLIHELGHIFGMLHDTRDTRNIMMRGYDRLGRLFDPKTASERPVRFSFAHARMAGATRFFSESFDDRDTKPPRIQEFKLAKPARGGRKTFEFSLKLSDDKGLGPLVVLQRGGGQIDAMVGEMDLDGKKTFSKTVRFECPRPLITGQSLVYIMNIIDVNGNISQSVSHSVVVK
jgi:hypothetical protein